MSAFRCGHPKTCENTTHQKGCAFCERVRRIVRQSRIDMERINQGTFYSMGERIARGLVG